MTSSVTGPTPSADEDEDGASEVDDLLRELAHTPEVPSPTLHAGDSLDRFRIERLLGSGGMGAVYLARDERLGRPVALKVLHPRSLAHADRRKRFLREAKAAAAIEHPEVARILEVGEADGRVFLVFEHVVGRTLRSRLNEGPLPMSEVVSMGRALCRALDAAHRAGVVHRDLKPENVLCTNDAGLKVLDFGLAQRLPTGEVSGLDSDVATLEGQVLGSPGYMSPEQALSSGTDHRTDLFSLGVVLFELAAGRRPFSGSSAMATLVATSRDRAPDVRSFAPDVPPRFARLLARCLSIDREKRPGSAAEIERELEVIEGGRGDAPKGALVAAALIVAGVGVLGWCSVSPASGEATAADAGEVARTPSAPLAPDETPAPRPPEIERPKGESMVASAASPSTPPSERARPSSTVVRADRAPPSPATAAPAASADWRRDPSFAEQK